MFMETGEELSGRVGQVLHILLEGRGSVNAPDKGFPGLAIIKHRSTCVNQLT